MEDITSTFEFLTMAQRKTIHYGFGKEYLSNWGIREALREIFQNFMDYGEYTTDLMLFSTEENVVKIRLTNDYSPEKLEFLRIGNSVKKNKEAIGKHGEGLKMAFLIFLREELCIELYTNKYKITPRFEKDENVGELFVLDYVEHNMEELKEEFSIDFTCPLDIYQEFTDNIITEKDIIFKHDYLGSIVDKKKGNIYSGGLFVANVENVSKAYDIAPSFLPLDRDRATPREFDISYHASQINEHHKKWTTKDLSYSDTQYITSIPDEIKKEITPVRLKDKVVFVDKDGDVIKNESVNEALKKDSFFKSIINKIKHEIAKGLGLYDLLIEFEKKHVHSSEAREDFKVILERI